MTKHKKIKNTGILFELLIRQITSDIMKNNQPKAQKIIEEFFNSKAELSKELALYQNILTEKFDKTKAEDFISIVLESRKQLNNKKLRSEKYNLINRISEIYDLKLFFKSKIPQYKIYASIFNLFEQSIGKYLNPTDFISSKYTILEHISKQQLDINKVKSKLIEEYSGMDRDMRLLTHKLLIEKFNEKYQNLDTRQKNLLREYINQISDSVSLKEYIDKEKQDIRVELKEYITVVTDDILKIKLTEIISQIDNFFKGTIPTDEHVTLLMSYYELSNELKQIHK